MRMGVDVFDSYVKLSLHFSYLTGKRIQIVLEVKREGKGRSDSHQNINILKPDDRDESIEFEAFQVFG